MDYPIRINKYLRDQGLASRREADALIEAGQVLVNGKPAKMGMLINDGNRVELKRSAVKKHTYLAYYKPRGLATQAPEGEESIIAEWEKKGLFPIGRLDKESEGLIILTNDGRLTTRLTGPDSPVEKEYLVKIREEFKNNIVAIFQKGMDTKTFGRLLPAKAELVSPSSLRVILKEGKRHQIRVMLSELGYTVDSLKRVRIGTVLLGKLKPGETRVLNEKDLW